MTFDSLTPGFINISSLKSRSFNPIAQNSWLGNRRWSLNGVSASSVRIFAKVLMLLFSL